MGAQLRELRPLLLAVYLPVLAGIGVLIVVDRVADVPLRSFFIDPVAEFNAPAYIGLVSNFGVVLWASAASVGLFGGWLLWGAAREEALFLGSAGAISAILMFDDLYLFHEEVFPDHAHIPQPLVLGAYGLIVVAFLHRFRLSILRSEYSLLLLAATFFVASIIVDLFVTPEEFFIVSDLAGRHLIEDGLKLLGIVTWALYFWRVSMKTVRLWMSEDVGAAG